MPPGAAEVRHKHSRSRQFFFVLAGEFTLETDGVRHKLHPHEGLEIPPGVAHQAVNAGTDVVEFILLSQPPSHEDRIPAP